MTEDSKMNSAVLNQFKVPFRLESNVEGADGLILLLQGDKNVNRDTGQWQGLHGFAARTIQSAKTLRRKAALGHSVNTERQ